MLLHSGSRSDFRLNGGVKSGQEKKQGRISPFRARTRFPFKKKVYSRSKLSKRTVSHHQVDTRTFSHLSQISCSIDYFCFFFSQKVCNRNSFPPIHCAWKLEVGSDNYFALERLLKQSLWRRKKDGKRPKNFPSSPSCLPASLFTQVLRTNSFQQLLSCSEQCQRNLPKLVFSDESSKRQSSALPSCFRFHVRERMSEDDSCEAKFCPKLIY